MLYTTYTSNLQWTIICRFYWKEEIFSINDELDKLWGIVAGIQYIRVAPVDLWPQIKGSLYIIISILTDIVTDVNT